MGRSNVGQRLQSAVGGPQVIHRVGKRESLGSLVILDLGEEINPADIGAVLQLRKAICAAKSLHHGRPRRELREQDGSRNIHPSLHSLGGNDNQVTGAVVLALPNDLVHLPSPIGAAKTTVDQRKLRCVSRLLLQLRGEFGVESLRPRHSIDDYQGHAARAVRVENLAGNLVQVGTDIRRPGRSGYPCRPTQRLLRVREPREAGVMRRLRIDLA